jgi:hypothetical protein
LIQKLWRSRTLGGYEDGCDGFCRAVGWQVGIEHGPGRSAAPKLLGGDTGHSITLFEESAPAGTETILHLFEAR